MRDGYLNKCKECNKADVRENRKKNISYYRDYDRKRGNRQSKDYQDNYKKQFPKKYKAHTMVGNQIRAGNIKRMSCEVCGAESAHAHHDDYDYPLSIRWLCAAHHCEWHAKNGEARNAS